MNNFEGYLQQKGLAASTRKTYQKYLKAFELYLENSQNSFQELTYKDLLAFIEYRKKQGHSKSYINHQLSALKFYLDFLVKKQLLPVNVGSGLFIRGRKSTLPSGLLSREELLTLYEQCSLQELGGRTFHHLRRKVILGLMVFQGLLPDEMQQLQKTDIDFAKALIQVPASRRNRSRTLKLSVEQVHCLQLYCQQLESVSLFDCNVRGVLQSLFAYLQTLHPLARHATQIKMSVLTEMLREKDLREVQYFAGHRFVSSTERYQTSHLQSLQNDLGKYHPLS
jgi:integrase/recombinase XerD